MADTIPEAIDVAPDAAKHEASKKQYPELNLSAGEFVITAISKDPIGLLQIWGVAVAAVLTMAGLAALLLYGLDVSGHFHALVAGGLAIVAVLIFLIAFLAAGIYAGNRLIITNESVIEERQSSLLARNQQTINLGNVQDVSFLRNGLFASLFNYGILRLSTEADQTNYNFTHVGDPRTKAALITNVIEAYNTYHGASD